MVLNKVVWKSTQTHTHTQEKYSLISLTVTLFSLCLCTQLYMCMNCKCIDLSLKPQNVVRLPCYQLNLYEFFPSSLSNLYGFNFILSSWRKKVDFHLNFIFSIFSSANVPLLMIPKKKTKSLYS